MDEIINLSRRGFLKASAMAGGGLVLGLALPGMARLTEAQTAEALQDSGKLNAFVRIASDNTVTVVVGLAEMGQGMWTSVPMMLAEELECDWSQVRVEQGPVDPAFSNPRWANFKIQGGYQAISGSSCVRNFGVLVRQAGATAREMLITAARQTWGVPDEALLTSWSEPGATCFAENGWVIHRPTGRRLSFGELADKAARLPVPENVPLKEPGQFKLLGQSKPRTDLPLKVDGSAVYGIDVKVPGMLIATVVHCPVFGGKVASVDDAETLQVPGVRQVVPISNGIAVVADKFWAARKGAQALKISWDEGPLASLSSDGIRQTYRELAQKPGAVRRSEGDVNQAMGAAAKTVEATYEVPLLDPACLEPMNATAHWKGDSLEIWAPTQVQSQSQAVAMEVSGLPAEKVTLHTTFLGGGFGRRIYVDFVAEAVEIAMAVDKPVKLIWTREEDVQHSFYRPNPYNVLSAGFDDQGKPTAWKHHIVGPSILSQYKYWGHLVKDGMDPSSLSGAGDTFPYRIPNVFVDYVMHNPGMPVGFWRSVGHSQNGFIMEGFIDELAHAAGRDPYEFRRDLLSEDMPRLKAVLELAAQRGGWGESLPQGSGRGIAAHFSYGSYCAQVAEVAVAEDGSVKVQRVVCAIDPGWVVNPDIVRAQMESAILYGLSGTLFGEITLENGRVQQSNFHDYSIPRIGDMPRVEVHILQGEGEQGGCGEPATPVIAPAVVNAIFAATGKRLRRLPVRPEDLRAG